MKPKDVGTAVGKGAVSGVTKWVVGILLTAVLGGGTVAVATSDDDDDRDDRPTTTQVEEKD